MWRSLHNRVHAFGLCCRGNFALITALIMPVLAGATGGIVDVYIYYHQVQALQNAVDGAAIAATREAALKGWTKETAEAVADLFIAANFDAIGSQTASFESTVEVNEDDKIVSVTIEQDHYGYFVVGYFKGSPQIRVSATAQAAGETNICVVGLKAAGSGTISLESTSRLKAEECAVYSNSANPTGLKSLSDAKLTAHLACTAGGYSGAQKNFNRMPLTDCPAVQDPLSQRPAPEFPACEKTNHVVSGETRVSLDPCIYHGGLTITDSAKATLKPGVHVVKNGPLIVNASGELWGRGVGIYFTGSDASFHFTRNTSIDLEAPSGRASGADAVKNMAGLLFFQDRNSDWAEFRLESRNAHNLLGTIYFPNGDLVIDTNQSLVANLSDYTAVVAQRLRLLSGPLQLNADYDATTVPVPTGLGPTPGRVRLVGCCGPAPEEEEEEEEEDEEEDD